MIEIKEFSFWYPGVDSPALRNISLRIEDGETVLILGPSGCGKSTLLLSMNGVVPKLTGGKVKGRVFVDGSDTRITSVASLASTVGLILQDPESQLSNLYVYDEVAFGPENLVLDENEIITRTDDALHRSGLNTLKDRSVFALSGGQKQRVAIAASLAMLPRTMLLDNPTSNLDPVGAAGTYQAIIDLRQDDPDLTIVLADNRPDHIIDIVDRVIVMDQGRLISDGSPQEVFSMQGMQSIKEMGIFLPQLVDMAHCLHEKGYQIDSIPKNLEQALDVIHQLDIRLKSQITSPINQDQPKLPDEQPDVLNLHDIEFEYPTGVRAVNGVTFNIKKGEFLCLVGQNGSGKTTLAKLMVGLLNAAAGEITFLSRNIDEIPLRELIGKVGYVFQYPEHQFVAHNVFDEIAYSLRAMNIPDEEVERRVTQMLGIFSLEGVRDASPLQLSKGQKRRLSVATMLVTKPEVLILDEPMTGQDRKNIENLLSVLNELREQGTTIIDITHDMEHVATYADRVVGMSEGKVVFDGSPEDLFVNAEVLSQLSLEPPIIIPIIKQMRLSGIDLPLSVTTVSRFSQIISVAEVM